MNASEKDHSPPSDEPVRRLPAGLHRWKSVSPRHGDLLFFRGRRWRTCPIDIAIEGVGSRCAGVFACFLSHFSVLH